MARVRISKLDRNRNTVITYNIYNMESISYALRTPVSPLPLPEEGADENILVKVEGNSATISLAYKIKEELTERDPPIFQGEVTVPTSLTIFNQWNIIQDQFVGTSIDDAYRFEFVEDNGSVVASWEGFITEFSARTSGDSPTVLSAAIDFIQGNVITTYELDGPSPPRSLSTNTGTSGQIRVEWQMPLDSGTGNPNIVGYRVQYRLAGETWTTQDTSNTNTFSDINNLTTGETYIIRVAARTSGNVGAYSPEIQATVT